MRTDVVSLGPVPSEEVHARLESPDYDNRAARECAAYIEAIRRVCGPEPDGARLRVAWRDHEYGRSLEVVCEFECDNPTAAEYAAGCDDSAPTTWCAAGMVAPRPVPDTRINEHAPADDPLPGTAIDLPVPPELAEAFGYSGPARFVAFYWSPCGDDVIATDGRSTGTGNSWTFLAYRRHRTVAPLLGDWNLGYSDADAEYCLVLDRERNRVSVAPLAETRAFLKAQHPPVPALSPEETAALGARIEQSLEEQRRTGVNPADVQRLMAEQRGRVGRMIAFLDRCPVPPGTGPTP